MPHWLIVATQTGRRLCKRQGESQRYLLFSNHKILWYISSIESRPAERITHLAEENATLDDSDNRWENTIEESYWKLSPQKDQSLYQNRPDWLLVAIRHIAAEKQIRKSDSPSPKVHSQTRGGTDKQWSRIETLHRLAEKGLITPAEYNSKISEIIAEQKLAHPTIDEQMELLHRLHQKNGLMMGSIALTGMHCWKVCKGIDFFQTNQALAMANIYQLAAP